MGTQRKVTLSMLTSLEDIATKYKATQLSVTMVMLHGSCPSHRKACRVASTSACNTLSYSRKPYNSATACRISPLSKKLPNYGSEWLCYAKGSDYTPAIKKLALLPVLPPGMHWRVLGDRTTRPHCVYPRKPLHWLHRASLILH